MNEPLPAPTEEKNPVAAPAPAGRVRTLAPWVLVAVLTIGAGYGYVALKRAGDALAAQLAATQSELAQQAAAARRAAEAAQARTEELARALDEVRNQRAALDQLYLELVRGRDEAALIDIERLITLAAQDLRFTGHVPTALNALQAADARLARLDRPQYVNLRRALARDIDRLRNVPVIDLTGIALKLDQLAAGVDTLPLLADPAIKPARSAPTPAPAKDPSAWDKIRAWLAAEFGELVRIREVETPDALLLSSVQQQLVRSQLRLRLFDARQALLARNERIFRADLAEAQALLTRYFDVKSPAGGALLLQLRQLAQTALNVEVPTLDESLAAVRATRPAPASVR
jgi:uroporphyrinogen III methyltransferase/synthase